MFENLKILYHQGKQYIPDIVNANIPGIFKGRPVVSSAKVDESKFSGICPTDAISINPVRYRFGKMYLLWRMCFSFS